MNKVRGKAIWTIAILVVALVALATWLLMPTMAITIAVDRRLTGQVFSGDYRLHGQSWEVDTWWLYEVADDLGRAYYFYPIMTTITVAYAFLAVPLWPLGYMVFRRKLRSTPRHFMAYLVSTSVAVGLGLWVYGLIPIRVYVR